MVRLKAQHWIWFFCFLIIIQGIWLNFRLDKLIKNSPENLLAQQQKQTKEKLEKIPEAKTKQELVQGGELWLKPDRGSFKGKFDLEIWAKTDRPVKKINLRLFYPPDILEVVDPQWQVDDKIGLAFWSREFQECLEKTTPGVEFLLKTISFKPLSAGKAKVEFDFNKESLLDCNLIDDKGRDELEKVSAGIYELDL